MKKENNKKMLIHNLKIDLKNKSLQIDNIEPKELLEYDIKNIDKNNTKVIIKRIKCECEIKFIDN